jgi:hypothetical protein
MVAALHASRFLVASTGAKFQHVPTAAEAVEHSVDRGGITHQVAPVFQRPVRDHQRTDALEASHDALQQSVLPQPV